MIFIGEASKQSGVSVKAIRHYEKIGLLTNIGRSGVYRVFTKSDIITLKLIKEAQRIGFKLSEFKQAFVLEKYSSWKEIEKMVQEKELLARLEIARLEEKRALLKEYSRLILDCLEKDPDCSKPSIKQFI